MRQKDIKFMTKEFRRYIISELSKSYPNDGSIKIVPESCKYLQWDDSDQPGIDERLSFALDNGDKFEAAMTHNRWQNLRKID